MFGSKNSELTRKYVLELVRGDDLRVEQQVARRVLDEPDRDEDAPRARRARRGTARSTSRVHVARARAASSAARTGRRRRRRSAARDRSRSSTRPAPRRARSRAPSSHSDRRPAPARARRRRRAAAAAAPRTRARPRAMTAYSGTSSDAVVPPAAIGMRNGSAATASSGQPRRPAVQQQRAEQHERQRRSPPRRARRPGRSRSDSTCSESQIAASSSTGVRTSAPSIAAARAAAASAAPRARRRRAPPRRRRRRRAAGRRRRRSSGPQQRPDAAHELRARRVGARSASGSPGCPGRTTRPSPNRAATMTSLRLVVVGDRGGDRPRLGARADASAPTPRRPRTAPPRRRRAARCRRPRGSSGRPCSRRDRADARAEEVGRAGRRRVEQPPRRLADLAAQRRRCPSDASVPPRGDERAQLRAARPRSATPRRPRSARRGGPRASGRGRSPGRRRSSGRSGSPARCRWANSAPSFSANPRRQPGGEHAVEPHGHAEVERVRQRRRRRRRPGCGPATSSRAARRARAGCARRRPRPAPASPSSASAPRRGTGRSCRAAPPRTNSPPFARRLRFVGDRLADAAQRPVERLPARVDGERQRRGRRRPARAAAARRGSGPRCRRGRAARSPGRSRSGSGTEEPMLPAWSRERTTRRTSRARRGGRGARRSTSRCPCRSRARRHVEPGDAAHRRRRAPDVDLGPGGRARRCGSRRACRRLRGSSSGRGTVSVCGPIDSTRGSGGVVSSRMLRGIDDRPALTAQHEPRRGTSRPRTRRAARRRGRPSARSTRSPASTLRSSTSSRTRSPSRSTIETSTRSASLSENPIRARSNRPSRLGEKNGSMPEVLDHRRRALERLRDEERGERRDDERGEDDRRGRRRHRRMSSPLGTVHSWYVSSPRLCVCASAQRITPRWQTTSAGSSRRCVMSTSAAMTRSCCSRSDSPPGNRQSSPPRRNAAHGSGSSRAMSSFRRSCQSPTSTSLRRSSSAARARAPRRRSPRSRARGPAGSSRARRSPRSRAASASARACSRPGVVERHVLLALEAALLVLGRLAVAARGGSPLGLHRVAAQAEPHRLERQHVGRRDVAEVDVGAEALDEVRPAGPSAAPRRSPARGRRAWAISSIRPWRSSPSGRAMPAVPVSRPSQMTFHAPASSSAWISSTQRYGAMIFALSFEPTSLSTVNPSSASRAMSFCFSAGSNSIVPSETSMRSSPRLADPLRRARRRGPAGRRAR